MASKMPRRKHPHGSGPEWPKMLYHPYTGDGCVFRSAQDAEDAGYVELTELEVAYSGLTTKRPIPVPDAKKGNAGKAKAQNPNKGAAAELGFESKADLRQFLDGMEVDYDARKSADDLAAEFREQIEEFLEDEDSDEGSDEDEDDEQE